MFSLTSFLLTISSFLLFLFAGYILLLTSLFLLTSPKRLEVPKVTVIRQPNILIQVPIFNEGELVMPLLRSLVEIEWPKESLSIQILDDSSHPPPIPVLDLCSHIRESGIDLTILTRPHRCGFKAGALENGLRLAKCDYVAVFDIDYIVPRDFLIKTVRLLQQYPDCACVQARCGFRNSYFNVLTLIQTFVLSCHFIIFNEVRWRMGWPVNFSGSCGLWRLSAINTLGSWDASTLVEDLDLSIRAHLGGWNIIYLSSLVVRGSLPTSLRSWKSQQFRWSKGITQCSIKYLKSVLQSPSLTLFQKASLSQQLLQPTSFLALNIITLTVLSTAFYCKFFAPIESSTLFPVGLVSAVGICINTAALVIGQQRTVCKTTVIGIIASLLIMPALTLVNSRAVIEGALGIYSPFVRTNKVPMAIRTLRANVGWPELMSSIFVLFMIWLTANPFSYSCLGLAFSLLLFSLIDSLKSHEIAWLWGQSINNYKFMRALRIHEKETTTGQFSKSVLDCKPDEQCSKHIQRHLD